MSVAALIEVAATLLWAYAALGLLDAAFCLRAGARAQAPSAAAITGALMPALIVLAIALLVAALFGQRGVVVLALLLVPAGIAYGLHVTVPELSRAPAIWRRLILAGLAGGAVIVFRQIL